jgi:hypothetical protein
MHNPSTFTPFKAWKGMDQHLERLLMDDYREFKCTPVMQPLKVVVTTFSFSFYYHQAHNYSWMLVMGPWN